MTTLPLGDKQWQAQELAEIFEHKAQNYAQALPGVQTFNILFFYNKENTPRERWPFTIYGVTDYGGIATEQPDERGMRQQGMRLVEGIVHRSFSLLGNITERYERMAERGEMRENALRAENLELLGMFKELLVLRSKEMSEQRMQELQFQRQTAEREALLKYVPALVNTITGREVFPQGLVDETILDSLADHITEDQFKFLMMQLPDDKARGVIADRFNRAMEKKKKLEDAAKRLPPMNEDPAEDAAGN